jgi:hypothetical protein
MPKGEGAEEPFGPLKVVKGARACKGVELGTAVGMAIGAQADKDKLTCKNALSMCLIVACSYLRAYGQYRGSL